MPADLLSSAARSIEWSLRAVRLFLRARAVINFLIRAASTLEITNDKQRALRKLSAELAPSNLVDTLKQDNRRKARQHDKAL